MLNNHTKTQDTNKKNKKQKLTYRKPKVYHLGAMDKVQAGPRGRYREFNGYYSG